MFLSLAIFGIVHTMKIPRKSINNTGIHEETKIVDGNVVTVFSTSPVITDEERRKRIGIYCFFLFMGTLFAIRLVTGRKNYLEIYDKHIEGASGTIFKSNQNINIPIQKISEISSSNLKSLVPSLVVRTITGNKITFIMDTRKVTEAETLLRNLLKQNSKMPEVLSDARE